MLSSHEIMTVVNDYIGVDAGNLKYFSFGSLSEFYSYYCDCDINIDDYPGTKRERFINILRQANSQQQAKILQGLLVYLPLDKIGFEDEMSDKKQKTAHKINTMITRLENSQSVVQEALDITNETVERAIQDAKVLIEKNGATSGVDRIHTALHGYLKQVCKKSTIEIDEEDSLTQLFSKLRANHPSLQNLGTRQNEIEKIINAFSNVLDKLNPIRNKASLSHPNEQLLEEDEAMFVVNAAQTVLNYLNRKFK